ncbi:hypothetical protein [Streptomyces sp. cg2]|uniref:hypothetical protein n=1 Tax=Streptomyces sp. cg2 TaxID=3238799 RepID=UPI0034E19F45
MVRNVLGSLIALAGATAAVWSPFRPWYDGRHGSDVRIEDLFNGLTGSGATLFGSLVLPMAFAGLLTLAGVALRSRLLVTLAGLVVLGFTVLWMVRQAQRSGELTAGAHGMGVGVANALGGGALLILGALIMRGRTRRVAGHEYEDAGYGSGYGDPYEDAYGDAYPRYEPPPPYGDPVHRPAEERHPEPYGPSPGAPDPPLPGHPVPPPSPSQRPTPPVSWGRELRQRDVEPAHEQDDRPTLPNRQAAPDHPTLPDRPNWPDRPDGTEAPHRPDEPEAPGGPGERR